MTPQQNNSSLRRLWLVAAWSFVIAAGAGVLFRWGMVQGFPWDLSAANIRHAHSHLMLMGWATPALMALMAMRWPGEGARSMDRAVVWVGWLSWLMAAASFVPFLLYGYASVPVGGAELPLAAILSGLAIIAWYAFAVIYFLAHRGVERTPAMRLWDLGVASLVVSSIGAWAIAGLMIAGVDDALLEAATVHFFVDLFGAGWLALGTLGLIRSFVPLEDSTNERVGRVLIGVGVAFVFLVGLPRAHVPQIWPLFGSAAAGLVAAGMALIIQRMWSRLGVWNWRALLFAALVAAMLAAVAIPPVADWGLRAGLRLFYLHVAFAGFVTMGLVAVAHNLWGKRATGSPTVWLAAVLVLLVTMMPMTGLWPDELGGEWVMQAVFAGAVVATVATLFACTRATLYR